MQRLWLLTFLFVGAFAFLDITPLTPTTSRTDQIFVSFSKVCVTYTSKSLLQIVQYGTLLDTPFSYLCTQKISPSF